MRIERIVFRVIALELREPFRISSGVTRERRILLVQLGYRRIKLKIAPGQALEVVRVPTGPGIGVELDEDYLAAIEVDRTELY